MNQFLRKPLCALGKPNIEINNYAEEQRYSCWMVSAKWDKNTLDDGWSDDDGWDVQSCATDIDTRVNHTQCMFLEPYEILAPSQVRVKLEEGISELEDLFGLDLDYLIIIARHYKWNQDKMQAWFTEKDKLKYQLGIRFDRTIAKKHPETKNSLPEVHGGYCPICYEEMNDQNSFALACGHTFCKECWKDYLESKVNSGNKGIDASCQ